MDQMPEVSVEKNKTGLTIHWTEAHDNTRRGITGFQTRTNGLCGVCSNHGNISKQNSNMSCTGWIPGKGQVCSVTVAAVQGLCGFESQNLLNVSIRLQCEYN